MKTVLTDFDRHFKRLIARALIAYSGAIGVVAVALVVSISHGAGWRPALAGMPLYVILFVGIAYQFIKELRALRREEEESKASLNPDDQ